MNTPLAPRVGHECQVENCEGEYVKSPASQPICATCGHVRGHNNDSKTYREQSLTDEWIEFERARGNYQGFHGPDRVKMVGGFEGPWISGD